jgi:hypothetical protein
MAHPHPSATEWIRDRKVISYQIWDTASLHCNECGRLIEPDRHYYIIEVDDQSGEWKQYKVGEECIAKVREALKKATGGRDGNDYSIGVQGV